MKIRNQTSRSLRQSGSVPEDLCSCAEMRARRHQNSNGTTSDNKREFEIPEPLRMNQNGLCVALQRAVLAGGKTGAAAKNLKKILQPHLLKEEDDLLQVLGLLVPVACGEVDGKAWRAMEKTQHLKSRMFEIMREHVEIIAAAHELVQAARAERKLSLVAFTERLMLRAWTDEVVFYPAAVLIGEYLKLKFAEQAKSTELRRHSSEL